MSEETPIDPEAIENLRSLNPDDGDAFLKDIIGIFLEDTPARIADLHNSMLAGDRNSFTRAAHSIKGSASNLGANPLRAVAGDLEHSSKDADLPGLAPTVAKLEAVFLTAKAVLEKYL